MPKPSTQDIILEELRTIQAEMKSANITLGRLSTTLDSVEQQVVKTNGRVNRLEMWRTAFVGGLTATGAMMIYLWNFIDTLIKKITQ